MRATVAVAVVAMLSACANTPQWDECSRDACPERAAVEAAERDCVILCEATPEVDPLRNCAVECATPPCQGSCPGGYTCVTQEAGGEIGRLFCAQVCTDGLVSNCTDPGTVAGSGGETICGEWSHELHGSTGCQVTCRYAHDDDCPPETRCVGATNTGGRGFCLP